MCVPWVDVCQIQPTSVTMVLSKSGSKSFNILTYSTVVRYRWYISFYMLLFFFYNITQRGNLCWSHPPTVFSISTAELTQSAFYGDIVLSLSPALHSNGMHWPFLSLCPGLQWRQWSAATQMMQSEGQGSHRFLSEWKNPSGQTSRHWPWKKYLATPNLSKCSKKWKGNLSATCSEGQELWQEKNKEYWCTNQVCKHTSITHQIISWLVCGCVQLCVAVISCQSGCKGVF